MAMMSLQQAYAWIAPHEPRARLVGNGAVVIARVHTDTRTLAAGDLFVALKGERYDANQFLPQAHAAGAVAGRARLEHHRPAALAGGAGGADGKETLRPRHLSSSAARRAHRRLRAVAAARTIAVVTMLVPGNLDLDFLAKNRVHETDRQVITQVSSPARSVPTGSPGPESEKIFEDVAERGENVVEVPETGKTRLLQP